MTLDDDALLAALEGAPDLALDGPEIMALVDRLVARIPEWRPVWENEVRRRSPGEEALARFLDLARTKDWELVALRTSYLAAIRQLNSGTLGRSLNVLDIARHALDRSRIDPTWKSRAISEGLTRIDVEKLQQLSRMPLKRRRLRQLLERLEPFSVEALLRKLLQDSSRLRRRFMLELLRVHGTSARDAALRTLSQHGVAGLPWYFRRNLVHLLRTIPASAPSVDELSTVTALIATAETAPLLRELIRYLGQNDSPAALTELTRLSTGKGLSVGSEAEREELALLALRQLLESRHPQARRTAVRHLLERSRSSAGHRQVLAGLGRSPLSVDVAAAILEAAREAAGLAVPSRRRWLPRRLDAGLLRAQLAALRSTSSPELERLIASLRSDRKTSRIVADLEVGSVDEEVTPTVSNGIPASGLFEANDLLELLACFEERAASGSLVLASDRKRDRAEIELREGRPVACRTTGIEVEADDPVAGIAALLQLPWGGRFDFEPTASSEPAAPPEPTSTVGVAAYTRCLAFLGLRERLPDHLVLAPRVRQPALPSEERDPLFARRVWQSLDGRNSIRDCQRDLGVEPLRMRNLLSYWCDAGALTVVRSEPATDPS